ncbi:hypothetical protein D3C81_2272050 [compost metagenome]
MIAQNAAQISANGFVNACQCEGLRSRVAKPQKHQRLSTRCKSTQCFYDQRLPENEMPL